MADPNRQIDDRRDQNVREKGEERKKGKFYRDGGSFEMKPE